MKAFSLEDEVLLGKTPLSLGGYSFIFSEELLHLFCVVCLWNVKM